MSLDYAKSAAQLKNLLEKGKFVWALHDNLGIKKDYTVTKKFQKVFDSLDEKVAEQKSLKDAMILFKEKIEKGEVKEAAEEEEEIKIVQTEAGESYYETKEHRIARKLFELGSNVYMLGPAGCGKTTYARILSGADNYYLSSISNDMKPSKLIGHFELLDEQTKFIEGPLVRAMKEGKVLILDEFDRASEDLASKLHEVLEAGQLLIEENNEMIKCHPNFRVIATGNSDMQGSVEYNTNALDLASIDRFEFVQFGYSPKEMKILEDSGMEKENAEILIDTVRILRKQNYSIVPTTRRLISIAALYKSGFSLQEAFDIGYTSRLPEAERNQVGALKKNMNKSKKDPMEVWCFKEDTPKNIIEEVAKLLPPEEAEIFNSTLTCVVHEDMSSHQAKYETWLDETIRDHEGVDAEEFFK
jgi:MoxR-like ATPase